MSLDKKNMKENRRETKEKYESNHFTADRFGDMVSVTGVYFAEIGNFDMNAEFLSGDS